MPDEGTGLDGLQAAAVISALPFAIILCAVGASLVKLLERDHRIACECEAQWRHALDRRLASRPVKERRLAPVEVDIEAA